MKFGSFSTKNTVVYLLLLAFLILIIYQLFKKQIFIGKEGMDTNPNPNKKQVNTIQTFNF